MLYRDTRLTMFAFAFVMVGSLGSSAALAQANPEAPSANAGLEEIVVTATRREERQQDVPISLTAFSSEALDLNGIRQIDDVTRLTPGVTFVRTGPAATGDYNDELTDINIRGIDSGAGASTTAIYVDDTPIQSRKIGFGTQNTYPAVFDLERVEILRGPQGTLFGASSEGGNVRFIQPSPGLSSNSGYLMTELASTKNGDPTYQLGAAAGGPIIDDVLGFRVSASLRRQGGWVDRVDYLTGQVLDPRANWDQTTTLRAALKWKVNDAVSVTPSFYYQELQVNDTAAFWRSLSNPADGVFKNGNARPNQATDPFYIAAVHVDWTLGWAEFVSNTSFYSRNQYTSTDYTTYLSEVYFGTSFPAPGAPGTSTAYLTDTQNNLYQEFRLQSTDANSRISWTAGLFYAHLNENSIENITAPMLNASTGGAACAQFPCPGGLIYYQPYDRVIDKQYAAFGEVVYRITDTFKATAGVRVSRDSYTGQTLLGGPFLGQATITSGSTASDTPVTPKGVLAWQPNQNNLIYVSAEKGFRVGGINAGVGNFCEANLAILGVPIGPSGHREAPSSFGPDSLWSYEIGGKNTFWDQRLQINSSLFYIDWNNIQQNVFLGECGLQYTANLGHVRSEGGDISVLIRPIDPLTLNLTASYVDAKYTKTACATAAIVCTGPNAPAAPVISEGDRLVGAPWKFITSLEYVFSPVFQRKPYIHLDYTHTTAQTALLPLQDPRNGVNDTTIPGLPVTNDLSMRAGLRWGGIDLSVFGNNLTNSFPIIFVSRDYAAPYVQQYWERSVRPRTYGVTATYRY